MRTIVHNFEAASGALFNFTIVSKQKIPGSSPDLIKKKKQTGFEVEWSICNGILIARDDGNYDYAKQAAF